MQNWFNTLSEALDAEGLLDTWDCYWEPMGYESNRRYTAEIDGRYHHVSLYRNERGMYERPVHYDAGKIR